MKVQVLMSTCHQEKLQDLKLAKRNIKKNCVIVNQFAPAYHVEKKGSTIMYSYPEKGISKSRNRLIEHATGDIGIITDDDITFFPYYDDLLAQAYLDYPDADVITFCTKKGSQILGSSKPGRHNLYSIMTVASFQISFRIASIRKHQIKIDEQFGLGSTYTAGEENIFLHDCQKLGLVVRHVPIVINEHPDEPTTGERWGEDLVKAKGAFSYRILKAFHPIFFVYFLVFKHKNYRGQLNRRAFIKAYRCGVREYKNQRK